MTVFAYSYLSLPRHQSSSSSATVASVAATTIESTSWPPPPAGPKNYHFLITPKLNCVQFNYSDGHFNSFNGHVPVQYGFPIGPALPSRLSSSFSIRPRFVALWITYPAATHDHIIPGSIDRHTDVSITGASRPLDTTTTTTTTTGSA